MKRVLIVDDDVSIVEGLQMFFEVENIAATGAFDRESAEAMMADEYFPIVLADLRLRTEADGLQLLEAIRRISPRTRIASMTGALDVDDARLRELGASVVLHKPFGPDEIVAIVRELLAEIERVETALAADAATTPSLEELYVAAQRVVHSIPMRRYGLTREDAEELVQETWCLFLEQRAAIRNPRPWLSGTIVNLCRRAIQDRYRDRDRAEREPSKSEAFEPTDDVRLIVQRGLAQLDDRARTLCELIGMEQWSYDEVSSHLGIPLGSVGPLYIRAKTKLRNAVASAN